jgi:hypothetical protein
MRMPTLRSFGEGRTRGEAIDTRTHAEPSFARRQLGDRAHPGGQPRAAGSEIWHTPPVDCLRTHDDRAPHACSGQVSSVDPNGTGSRKPDGTGSLMDTRFVLSPPEELADPNMLYVCNGNSCHCASACFLIWAAGIERHGNSLGLRRPSTRSTNFADLPPDRASALYRTLLAEIGFYLLEMDVPRRFIDVMTDTSSSDIRWLEDAEASFYAEAKIITEFTLSPSWRRRFHPIQTHARRV